MNLTTTAAVLILIIFNGVLGLLLLLGKVKLVRTGRPTSSPAPVPISEVVTPDFKTGKRGRPRKGEQRRHTRHLHLPATISDAQVSDALELFHNHQDDFGDRIVLHVPTKEGRDRTIESPYLVRWNDQVKAQLSAILEGWL